MMVHEMNRYQLIKHACRRSGMCCRLFWKSRTIQLLLSREGSRVFCLSCYLEMACILGKVPKLACKNTRGYTCARLHSIREQRLRSRLGTVFRKVSKVRGSFQCTVVVSNSSPSCSRLYVPCGGAEDKSCQ